jgi:hypothetical protein
LFNWNNDHAGRDAVLFGKCLWICCIKAEKIWIMNRRNSSVPIMVRCNSSFCIMHRINVNKEGKQIPLTSQFVTSLSKRLALFATSLGTDTISKNEGICCILILNLYYSYDSTNYWHKAKKFFSICTRNDVFFKSWKLKIDINDLNQEVCI